MHLTTVLAALGGAGGIIAVLASIIVMGRGIFRQISVIEELSTSVRELTKSIMEIKGILNSHETRLTVLEDRAKR